MFDVKVVCVVHCIIVNLAHAIKRMKCFHPEFNGMECGLYERSVVNLSEDQKPLLYNLLGRNTDVFSCGSGDLGKTDLVRHKINTGDAAPIRQPPRRLPSLKKDEANKAVTEMLEQGLIETSTSPWASPIVLVRKKDGNWRFCVDYRKLNDVTRKDSYPLPRIEDTLDRLAGMQWFSTLDLKSGYWQVEMEPKDKENSFHNWQ